MDEKELEKSYQEAARGIMLMVFVIAVAIGLCFAAAVGVGCGVSALAWSLGIHCQDGGSFTCATSLGFFSGAVTLMATGFAVLRVIPFFKH